MYKPGQWRALCDVCGFKYWSGEMRKRWDGLMVCPKDFELDHPQKYIKVQEESQGTPWARPEPAEDTFIGICYIYETYAYAGIGSAGCMVAGKNTPLTAAQCIALRDGTA